MTAVLFTAALAAIIGLWIAVCRMDRETCMALLIAAILMMAGAVTALGWAVGFKPITEVWLTNGVACLLFGLAIWLAFDRRRR